MAGTIGSEALGTEALGGGFSRAAPSVVVDPIGTLTTSPVTVTWTYSSPVSRAQASYWVRLLSQDGSAVIYNGGIVTGSGTSATLDVVLSAGSTYQASVMVYDGYDWSSASTTTFLFDGSTVEDYPDEPGVGSVYEVAINGVGYMLADHPERAGWERRVVPLDPQRLATGDTPFSEAIDRYTMIGHTDWSDGAGQRLADRDTSSKRAYLSSTSINPFTPGQLSLLPGTTQLAASVYATQLVTVAGGKLYATTGAAGLAMYADPDTAASTFSIAAGSTVSDLCSDGYRWYWCDGTGIWTNDEAVDPGAAWSSASAERMAWCSDRLIIARSDGTSTTPNVVAVLNYSTGAEVGTPWSYEIETDVRSITSGDGYAWWAAARFDRSVVYAWQIGSTDAPFVALELPAGQDIQSVGYYQGNVFVRATEQTAAADRRAIVYRAPASQGRLTPERVVDLRTEGIDHSAGVFAGDDRFVYFSWKEMDTNSGIGCIDLSTGGWAKWLTAPGGTGVVQQIVQWYGRTVFTVAGYGIVIEDVPVGADDGSTSTGVLYTSVSDLNTSMRKMYHKLDLVFDPLPSGATIEVAYSTDAAASWTALSPTVTADGAKTASWDVNVESDSIALRFTLTHGGTDTPVIRSATVRAHPIGIADQVLVLPINCADQLTGVNNRPLTESGPHAGVARARALEALVQTRVRVQDVDWPVTGVAHVYDLVAAESKRVGVFNRHTGKQSNSLVTTLTLRRAYK